jgi:glycosyltransferase involved in cell wall biosynthesis
MSGPLVSVVVPTLNAARYLREGLDSVAAQTYPNWEVVLVDGGSEDETLAIAAGYERVRVLRQQSTGLAGAWNEGIEAARGGFVAFLDSDDLWEPEKLDRQVAALEADPAVDGAVSLVQFVLEPGYAMPPELRPELFESPHPAPVPSALLARGEVFDRVGLFDTRWETASDVDWFARAGAAGVRIDAVPELLVRKRFHDSNLSLRDGGTVNRELLEVLRLAAHRHGEAS